MVMFDISRGRLKKIKCVDVELQHKLISSKTEDLSLAHAKELMPIS